MSKQEFSEYVVLGADGIVATKRYGADARSAARDHVKANPGTKVRVYQGQEHVYSYVAVDDDRTKSVDQP